LVLKDDKGYGMMVKGSPLLSFSALHYSQEDFDREKRDGSHTIDLEKKEEIFLNVDLEQMGVGGDNSWGARTHANYSIRAEPMEFWYVLIPLSPGDDYWEKANH
jgi:beta-galactosidase